MSYLYTASEVITPGTPVEAGEGVIIVATVAGNVGLKLQSGGTLVVYVDIGTSKIDGIAVIDVVSGSTTATCTVNLMRSPAILP